MWSHELAWKIVPHGLSTYLLHHYPRFDLTTPPFQIEESAALGFGVTCLILLAAVYGLRGRLGHREWLSLPRPRVTWFVLATGLALIVYMSKLGSEAAPRLIAVYYIPAAASILAISSLSSRVVHRVLWKLVSYAAILMVFPLVILSPGCPLLPPPLFEAGLRALHIPASIVSQLDRTLRARETRRDYLG